MTGRFRPARCPGGSPTRQQVSACPPCVGLSDAPSCGRAALCLRTRHHPRGSGCPRPRLLWAEPPRTGARNSCSSRPCSRFSGAGPQSGTAGSRAPAICDLSRKRRTALHGSYTIHTPPPCTRGAVLPHRGAFLTQTLGKAGDRDGNSGEDRDGASGEVGKAVHRHGDRGWQKEPQEVPL